MEAAFWTTMLLTLRLALLTTLCLLLLGLPLAYGLSRLRHPVKPVLEALLSLPIVLPPTVLGFYLLFLFSPERPLGGWLQEQFDLRLVFNFAGLLLGSILYSLPFMVQPLQSGLQRLPPQLAQASYTLGKSRWTTFWRIELPNIRSSLLTGIVLSFAHTVGEFGVVLMIGGNIPGRTRVASIALFEEVEAMNYGQANRYALWLMLFSFLILLLVYGVNGRRKNSVPLDTI